MTAGAPSPEWYPSFPVEIDHLAFVAAKDTSELRRPTSFRLRVFFLFQVLTFLKLAVA
jgi:hypothetical protein